MLSYEIAHHVPGRIRIKVPILKKLSLSALLKLAANPFDAGILDIRPNPMTGSLVALDLDLLDRDNPATAGLSFYAQFYP
jgi:hypothetical protein